MIFTVDVIGHGRILKNFEHEVGLAMDLQEMFDKKENGLTELSDSIVITATNAAGSSVYYEGTLSDFITPAKFLLNVGRNGTVVFDERKQLDDFLRDLVNQRGYSIKESISIIDEGKTGNYINQFLGEIWHYLNDWDEAMLGNAAPVLRNILV